MASADERRKRADSRGAYGRVDAREAAALAKRAFFGGRSGWRLPYDPADVKRYLSPFTAIVDRGEGPPMVARSTTPLRSAVGSGEQAPVSLALEQRSGALVPRNPVVPVQIATDPADGVAIAGGITVRATDPDGGQAPVIDGDRALFADVSTWASI